MAPERRVLIVDDNVGLAENIAEVLRLDGHITEVAGSAEEALGRLEHDAPDVVVTDYRLPGLGGAALLKQIRKLRGDIRGVVISACTDEETLRQAEEAGAAFVAKPVDLGRLRRLVSDGG
jgi:CheY-like chemotaxis protein